MLGVAALVASVFSQPNRHAERASPQAPVTGDPEKGSVTPGGRILRFRTGGEHEVHTLPPGRAGVITVSVEEPGQVEVKGLGLTATAEEHTPARFDVFDTKSGRFRVIFAPAGNGKRQRVGILAVQSERRMPVENSRGN